MLPQIDDKQCPLCHGKNHCQSRCKTPCWCCRDEVKFPVELTSLVPDEMKRKACICRACVEAYHVDPEGFTRKHTPER